MQRSKKKLYQEKALENLEQVSEYAEWLISKFNNHLGKNILELGSGIGGLATKLKEQNFNITPTDIDPDFLKILKKIDKNAFFLNILDINRLITKNPKPDTIIATNVLEHIEDDIKSLKNIHKLLSKKGTLILIVPAHNWLFGSYDKLAGHYRRYSKYELSEKLLRSGFRPLEISYYNKLSAIGWFVNAKMLRRNGFPRIQLHILKILLPFLNFIDRNIPLNFGLSIICIAKKTGV